MSQRMRIPPGSAHDFFKTAPTGEARRGNVYTASAGEGGGISFTRKVTV